MKFLIGHFGQFSIHLFYLQNFGQPNKISPQNFSYQKHHFKFISKKREKKMKIRCQRKNFEILSILAESWMT